MNMDSEGMRAGRERGAIGAVPRRRARQGGLGQRADDEMTNCTESCDGGEGDQS